MTNKRYSKQTQSNPIFATTKPMQPSLNPVIPTEGTRPACRSGGIYFNTPAISQSTYLAQFAKESSPVLCKTNPILFRTKPMQLALPQGFMQTNGPQPTRKTNPNKPNPCPKLELCSTLSEVEGPIKPNLVAAEPRATPDFPAESQNPQNLRKNHFLPSPPIAFSPPPPSFCTAHSRGAADQSGADLVPSDIEGRKGPNSHGVSCVYYLPNVEVTLCIKSCCYLVKRPTKPPPLIISIVSVSPRRTVLFSRTTAPEFSLLSRTSDASYWPSPRNDRGV